MNLEACTPRYKCVISSEARNPYDVALTSSVSGNERILLPSILARGIVSSQGFLVTSVAKPHCWAFTIIHLTPTRSQGTC
jgi:hypothetical protein